MPEFHNHGEEVTSVLAEYHEEKKMKVAVFEVSVHQESNNLFAMVQVISTTRAYAERMVLRTFFKNGSWTVVDTKKVRDL